MDISQEFESDRKKPAELTDVYGDFIAPTPHKIDLHDAHAIRREMGSVYRDMRSGRLDIQVGTRLTYVLDMLRKAYETGVLQYRINVLEHTLSVRKLDHES